jgi:hypothetical protein
VFKWHRDKQWRISFVWAVAFVICWVWFWYMQCGFSDWEQLCLLDWTAEDGSRPILWNVFCSEYWMVVEVQIMSNPKCMGIWGSLSNVAEGSVLWVAVLSCWMHSSWRIIFGLLDPEGEHTMVPWNTGNYLSIDTVSPPKWHECSILSIIYHYQKPLELKIFKHFWILSCDMWCRTHIFLRFCVYLIKKNAVL